jgi:hypothetical protein
LIEIKHSCFADQSLSPTVLEVQDRSSSACKEDGEAQQHLFAHMTRGPDGIKLCFLQGLQSLNQALNLIVSLIWVPVLWIMQLISMKFQGRNRQSNNNRRKDGAGGSNACLAHDIFQKIHKRDGGLTFH